MAQDLEEPPVGFSVCYYDSRGLRVVPVPLAVHDGRDPEVLRQQLFVAWQSLCNGLQPIPAPPVPMNRDARRTVAAVLRQHGDQVRSVVKERDIFDPPDDYDDGPPEAA